MEHRFLAIEIQTNQDGTVGNLVYAYDEINQAQSKYHAVLSAAAVSELPMHAAVLVRSDGAVLASDYFDHSEPEPEVEEEVVGDD